jgi:hypothetical protein
MEINYKRREKYNFIEIGEGTPIVILHGLMGGLVILKRCKLFSSKGYKIVIP